MSANMTASYLTQLGLHTPPFADSNDEAFFYADPERSKYLDMLQHLLQYSEEILLLTGEAGIGKTTLLDRLAARADEQWLICHLDCSETTGADTLFAQIAACFNLQAGGGAEKMLEAFHAQLDELHQQRFPVLLIDDAQNLSEDALEMVLHLAVLDGSNGKLLHLVMAGDGQLIERLKAQRFSSLPPPHRLELDGLGEAHGAAYLMRRLQAAGHEGDSPFSVTELKQLHKESEGIPGKLNTLANQLLNKKYGKRLSSSNLRRVIQGGIAATALLGTVLGLHDRIGALWSGEEKNMAPAVQQVKNEPVGKAVAAVDAPVAVPPKAAEAPVVKVPEKPAEPQLVVKKEPVKPAQTPLVVKQEVPKAEPILLAENSVTNDSTGAASAELKLLGTDPDKVIGSSEPQRLLIRGSGFRPGTKVALSRDGKVQVLQQDLVEFINPTRLAINVTPGLKQSDWAVQVSTPDNRRSNVLHFQVMPPAPEEKEQVVQQAKTEPAVTTTAAIENKPQEVKALPPAKPRATAAPKRERATHAMGTAWYSSQPKGNYTLQLLASQSRTNIDAYIRQHALPEPLAHFRMQSNGRTLYVLTHGSFPDKPSALKAAGKLPREVKSWARPIANVQQVMLPEEKKSATAPAVDAGPDTAWIWSQDPARYTIQLAAGSSEAAVLRVKQQVTLPDELAVAKALRNGKSWFVLVYGSFSTKESARDTIGRLPASLRQSGPWVRSFSSLQDELSRSTPSQ